MLCLVDCELDIFALIALITGAENSKIMQYSVRGKQLVIRNRGRPGYMMTHDMLVFLNARATQLRHIVSITEN